MDDYGRGRAAFFCVQGACISGYWSPNSGCLGEMAFRLGRPTNCDLDSPISAILAELSRMGKQYSIMQHGNGFGSRSLLCAAWVDTRRDLCIVACA